jgi:hypothetical protein
MSKDFNKKTEIEELACKILESIINTFSQPKYLSQRHKENSEYYDEFEKEFEKGLSYEQKKDLDSLISIKNAVESTQFDYTLLLGMQIKSAIEEIIKNPLKILNLYDNEGIPVRDIYKSIKQRSEGVNNG